MGVTTMNRSAGELCAPLQRRGLEHGSHLFAEEYPRVRSPKWCFFHAFAPPFVRLFFLLFSLRFFEAFLHDIIPNSTERY
jgi:hypothetical protein